MLGGLLLGYYNGIYSSVVAQRVWQLYCFGDCDTSVPLQPGNSADLAGPSDPVKVIRNNDATSFFIELSAVTFKGISKNWRHVDWVKPAGMPPIF
jgi:hypothetical protein